LADPDDDLRIMEDLGLDSLTLMEAIVLIEDVLQITIENEELRRLRTVGDIRGFIHHKAQGLPPPQPSKFVSTEEIHAIMPQQSPFLFVEEANISSSSASGTYRIVGDEVFLEGHFKDNPVFPASLMLEALGQLADLYLLQAENADQAGPVDPKEIYFTVCDGVRCHRMCRTGDELKLSVKPKRLRMPIATFEGSIRVGQEKAAVAEEINLTFAYAAAITSPAESNGTEPAG
jgi:3-hydroxyacyl-[acyl-carrier-protein] dehydratase